MMLDLKRKISLSHLDLNLIFDQILTILNNAGNINLTATISDGNQYIDKIKYIDFEIEAYAFRWHFKTFIHNCTQSNSQ